MTEEQRQRLHEFFGRELGDLSPAELVELVRLKHGGEEIPVCRVCGGPLNVTRAGGGAATIWACSGLEDDPDKPGELRRQEGRGVADKHYAESRWTQHWELDSAVLELANRYERLSQYNSTSLPRLTGEPR